MNSITNIYSASRLDDLDLVQAYQQGDLPAGELIIQRYLPMVHNRTSQILDSNLSEFDRQDCVGEGIMGLFIALGSYDPSRGASFKTYAFICISNRIRNFCYGASKRERCEELSLINVDEFNLADSELDPQQIISEKESVNHLHKKLRKLLTKLEYDILLYFSSGLSYQEIANRLLIGTKTVDNALVRCRRKLGSLPKCL